MNNIVKFENGRFVYDGKEFSKAINEIIKNIDDINALWWLRSEMNITLDARFAERTDHIIYDSIQSSTTVENMSKTADE